MHSNFDYGTKMLFDSSPIFDFNHAKSILLFFKTNTQKKILLIFVFSLIAVSSTLILNILFPVHYRPNYRTEAVKQLGKTTEVLFLGSSVFFTGIDPSEIELQSVTLSTGTLNYETQLIILKKILKNLTNLKLVALELDNFPLTINTTQFRRSRSEGDFRDLIDLGLSYYEIPDLNPFWATKYALQDGFFSPILKGTKFSVNKKWFQTKKIESITPGFIAYKTKYNEIKKTIKKSKRIGKLEKKNIYNKQLDNTEALLEMISILNKKAIKIAFFRMPRLEPDKKNLDTLFKLIEPFHLPVSDFEDLKSLKESHFKDKKHLNMYGAQITSRLINRKIIDYLKND